MSEDVIGAIGAIVTQIFALIVLLRKARKTEVKVDKVESLVNGQSSALQAKLNAQEKLIASLLGRLPPRA